LPVRYIQQETASLPANGLFNVISILIGHSSYDIGSAFGLPWAIW